MKQVIIDLLLCQWYPKSMILGAVVNTVMILSQVTVFTIVLWVLVCRYY
jgi:hypothetical protein